MSNTVDLFGNLITYPRKRRKEEVFNDYDGFVEKFKPKKTTDDCYTPKSIYDALLKYIDCNVQKLDAYNVVRPFWPGADYKLYDYKPNDIVIDNPPFSILSKIVDFYIARHIRFWLFAPHLTLFQYSNRKCTMICTSASITYDNGAVVNTDFVTNLYDEDLWVYADGKLHDILKEADKLSKPKKKVNKYKYPINVTTSAELGNYISNVGESFAIKRNEGIRINKLDCQIGGKAIFGSGILLNRECAKAKAEAKAEAKAKAMPLSEREKEIIRQLSKEE